MIVAGGLAVILAWLMLCVAVSGAIWLALNWPRHNRFDPMQDIGGDVPNVPDGWR